MGRRRGVAQTSLLPQPSSLGQTGKMVQRCSGTRRTTPGMKRGTRISQLRSEQSATCGLSLWRWPRSRGRSSGAVPPLRDCAGRGVQVTARLRGVRGRGLAMPLVAAVAEFGADRPRSRAGGTHPASAPSSPGALASCVSRRPVSAFSRCRRRLHQPRDPALPRGPEPHSGGREVRESSHLTTCFRLSSEGSQKGCHLVANGGLGRPPNPPVGPAVAAVQRRVRHPQDAAAPRRCGWPTDGPAAPADHAAQAGARHRDDIDRRGHHSPPRGSPGGQPPGSRAAHSGGKDPATSGGRARYSRARRWSVAWTTRPSRPYRRGCRGFVRPPALAEARPMRGGSSRGWPGRSPCTARRDRRRSA